VPQTRDELHLAACRREPPQQLQVQQLERVQLQVQQQLGLQLERVQQ
jgi:hypothetical protein